MLLNKSARSQVALIATALAAFVIAAFSRTLAYDFLLYDDNYFVFANPTVRQGLTWPSVKWALTSTWGFWHPLTRLSHLLDWTIWGQRPGGHHLTNVLLHAFNTVVLFVGLQKLTKTLWPSAWTAALFALHPLNVEPVAWISERKGLLCGAFTLCALWAYASYCERRTAWRYVRVSFLYLLALMAKPMALTLPAVFILLDFWPLDRWKRLKPARCVAEKLPLLILALGFSALTYGAQRGINATASWEIFPIKMRLANALVSYVAYLYKVLWPAPLAAFYPHPYRTIAPGAAVSAALLLIIVTVGAFEMRKKAPYLLVGWLWWLGMLVPVIGVVQIGRQAMADHYAYLPTIGLFIATVWGTNQLATALPFLLRWRPIAAAISVLALGAVTLHQLEYWQNTEELFQHARQVTQRNWLAEEILGTLRQQENQLDDAEQFLRKSIEYLAEDSEIRGSVREQLAQILLRKGEGGAAIDELKKAVVERPNEVSPHQQLADILSESGHYQEAIAQYSEALRLRPKNIALRVRLAKAFDSAGRLDEAAAQLFEVTRLIPRDATAHYALGTVYFRQGRMDDAVNEFRGALALRPDLEMARRDLTKALEHQRRAAIGSEQPTGQP